MTLDDIVKIIDVTNLTGVNKEDDSDFDSDEYEEKIKQAKNQKPKQNSFAFEDL